MILGIKSVAVCRYLLPIYILVISLLAESAALAAPSFTFTDDPLTSQVTSVKAVHITELRQAINSLRSRNGLSPSNFTDSTLTPGVTPIRPVHITEMRTALNGVFAALGQTPPTYTDPTILAGQMVVKRAHISEIRNAVGVVDVFTLTVNQSGTGNGTVTSSPTGINCGATCTATFAPGTSVTLTATPAANSTFAGFSGNVDCSDGVVTMNANKTCTATFNLQQFTLTVNNVGSGSGTVTSTPAGINCGADCSETFTIDTSVTLTATPAADSTFAGFSGDADCSDGVVTMNADRTCTATFNLSGVTFSIADLDGTWNFHEFSDAPSPSANDPLTSRGTITIDSSGAVTGGSFVDSDGVSGTITGGSLSIDSNGVITGTITGPGFNSTISNGKLDSGKTIGAYVGFHDENFPLMGTIIKAQSN